MINQQKIINKLHDLGFNSYFMTNKDKWSLEIGNRIEVNPIKFRMSFIKEEDIINFINGRK